MFEIPSELVEDIVQGKVTLFVGAGLSVDAGLPDWDTLIRPLADRLGIPGTAPLNHLDVISEYAATASKVHLIKHIQDGTDTTDKNPTDNHRRLARLAIRNWITTNYDDLIEKTLDQMGQRCNIVVQSIELSFIGPDVATLMRLHGMRKQPGSLVITREDYNLWPTNNPLVYQKLQSFLTESTLLFVGYSLRDPDFALARDRVSSILGDMMRPSYGVFFDLRPGQVEELRQRNVRAINLSVPKGVEPSVLLGIWLEDLIRQVDLAKNQRRGGGNLPSAVVDFYKSDPPSMQDHASKRKILRDKILARDADRFLEIVGESGRGKTRLLLEAIAEVSSGYAEALLIYLDLETLVDLEPERRPLAITCAILDVIDGPKGRESSDLDALTEQVLMKLHSYRETPVCLIFDTTEALSVDTRFWRWLEKHLVAPVLNEKKVVLLFAGRTEVHFWDVQCKLQRDMMRLEDFEQVQAFQRLAQDVLLRKDSSKLKTAQWVDAQRLATELSSRHPGLCVQMSAFLAQNGISDGYDKVRIALGREVLEPFVKDVLFRDRDDRSREILKLVSVFSDCDPESIRAFLRQIDPFTSLADDELAHAIHCAINGPWGVRKLDGFLEYQQQHQRQGGYTLSSTLTTVVRHSFELNEPDRYRQALAAKESVRDMLLMEEHR